MESKSDNIFDRRLYLARLERTKSKRPDILSQSIAVEMADRLQPITREFNHACLIAVDPEPVASAIRASGKVINLEILEPAVSEVLALKPASFDAIFSILDLHLVNDAGHMVTYADGGTISHAIDTLEEPLRIISSRGRNS